MVEKIIASPEPFGYRNKCEFSFGQDLDNKPSLGFRVTSFPDVRVDPPFECPNVPAVLKMVVGEIINFLKTSRLKPYDQHSHSGNYRTLTTRYSKRTGGLVVMICVSLKEVDVEAWSSDLKELEDIFRSLWAPVEDIDESVPFVFTPQRAQQAYSSSLEGRKKMVSGFCFQVYNGVSVPNPDDPVTSVYGDMSICEELLGCRFEVSPQAFFQVFFVNIKCIRICALTSHSLLPSAFLRSDDLHSVHYLHISVHYIE